MDRPSVPEEVDETRTHVDLHLSGGVDLVAVGRCGGTRLFVTMAEGGDTMAVYGDPRQLLALADALRGAVERGATLPPLPPMPLRGEHVEERPDGATVVRPVAWPALEVAAHAHADA